MKNLPGFKLARDMNENKISENLIKINNIRSNKQSQDLLKEYRSSSSKKSNDIFPDINNSTLNSNSSAKKLTVK